MVGVDRLQSCVSRDDLLWVAATIDSRDGSVLDYGAVAQSGWVAATHDSRPCDARVDGGITGQLWRDRAVVARESHKLQAGGSIPPLATLSIHATRYAILDLIRRCHVVVSDSVLHGSSQTAMPLSLCHGGQPHDVHRDRSPMSLQYKHLHTCVSVAVATMTGCDRAKRGAQTVATVLSTERIAVAPKLARRLRLISPLKREERVLIKSGLPPLGSGSASDGGRK